MVVAQCETEAFCALIGWRRARQHHAQSAFGPTVLEHPNNPRPPYLYEYLRNSYRTPTLGFALDGGSKIDTNSNTRSTMTDNTALGGAPKSAGANGSGDGVSSSSAAGIPFYEKQRQHLKELITRKRTLEKRLVRFPPPPRVSHPSYGGINCLLTWTTTGCPRRADPRQRN
jgi:chromatin modification-related protein EAF6